MVIPVPDLAAVLDERRPKFSYRLNKPPISPPTIKTMPLRRGDVGFKNATEPQTKQIGATAVPTKQELLKEMLRRELVRRGALPESGGGPAGARQRAAAPSEEVRGRLRAFTGAAIESVPIVGPSLKKGADYVRSLKSGTTPEQAAQETAASQAEYPGFSTGGAVVGTVAPLVGLGATAFGAKALGISGSSVGGRVAAATTSGGAISAGDTAARGGSAKDVAVSAATGAAVSPIAMGLGQLAGKAVGAVKKAPASQALMADAKVKFDALKARGLQFTPTAWQSVVDDIRTTARTKGVTLPKSMNAYYLMRSSRGGSPTLEEVDNFRQFLETELLSKGPKGEMAELALQKVDSFLENAKATQVARPRGPGGKFMKGGGNPDDARELRRVRTEMNQAAKGEEIEGLLGRAMLKAKGRNMDMEKAIRDEFTTLSTSNRMKLFSPAEKAAIESVVKGGPMTNVLRKIGSYNRSMLSATMGMGAGGSVGGSIGFAAGGLPGAIVGAAAGASAVGATAAGARRAALARTGRSAEAAREQMLLGGPIDQMAYPQRTFGQALGLGTELERRRDGY